MAVLEMELVPELILLVKADEEIKHKRFDENLKPYLQHIFFDTKIPEQEEKKIFEEKKSPQIQSKSNSKNLNLNSLKTDPKSSVTKTVPIKVLRDDENESKKKILNDHKKSYGPNSRGSIKEEKEKNLEEVKTNIIDNPEDFVTPTSVYEQEVKTIENNEKPIQNRFLYDSAIIKDPTPIVPNNIKNSVINQNIYEENPPHRIYNSVDPIFIQKKIEAHPNQCEKT